MKYTFKSIGLLLASICVFSSTYAQAQTKDNKVAKPKIKTYTLIVANNGSVDEGVKPLRFADDDGARYYETFSHLSDRTTLLTTLDSDSQKIFKGLAAKTQSPTRANLIKNVNLIANLIKKDRKQGIKSEVYLIFTGHGNVDKAGQGYLSLQGGKLLRKELFATVLKPLKQASFTHLIIDACHAYFMVQSRGGPWKDDRSGQTLDDDFQAYIKGKTKTKKRKLPNTLGVILSTSGTAEVHEWSKYRAGVFSHQLRSGILGGADVDHDGHVTYLELEAYLAAANSGVTNPKARINVYAKAPAQNQNHPLITLARYKNATRLTLPKGKLTRFSVEDARGIRYADLHRDASGPGQLILLKQPVGNKPYYLSTNTSQAKISLANASISATSLTYNKIENQARSSVEESYRNKLFAVPFGPGFFAGFQAGRQTEQNTTKTIFVDKQTSSWKPHLEMGYGISTAMLNLSGLQHNIHLRVPLEHDSGFVISPTLGYGFSTHTNEDNDQLLQQPAGSSYQVHRLQVGAQFGYRTALNDAQTLHLEPTLGLGYQAVFLNGAQLSADPLGFRADAGLRFGFEWIAKAPTHLHVGAGFNTLRQTGLDNSQQTFFVTPFLSLEQRFF